MELTAITFCIKTNIKFKVEFKVFTKRISKFIPLYRLFGVRGEDSYQIVSSISPSLKLTLCLSGYHIPARHFSLSSLQEVTRWKKNKTFCLDQQSLKNEFTCNLSAII